MCRVTDLYGGSILLWKALIVFIIGRFSFSYHHQIETATLNFAILPLGVVIIGLLFHASSFVNGGNFDHWLRLYEIACPMEDRHDGIG